MPRRAVDYRQRDPAGEHERALGVAAKVLRMLGHRKPVLPAVLPASPWWRAPLPDAGETPWAEHAERIESARAAGWATDCGAHGRLAERGRPLLVWAGADLRDALARAVSMVPMMCARETAKDTEWRGATVAQLAGYLTGQPLPDGVRRAVAAGRAAGERAASGVLTRTPSGWVPAVAGALPSAPAWAAGSPECMLAQAESASATAPMRVWWASGCWYRWPAERVAERAGYLAGVVQALRGRRSVELWFYDTECMGGGRPDGASIEARVPGMGWVWPVAADDDAALVCSAVYSCRVLGLRWMSELCGRGVNIWPVWAGLGLEAARVLPGSAGADASVPGWFRDDDTDSAQAVGARLLGAGRDG